MIWSYPCAVTFLLKFKIQCFPFLSIGSFTNLPRQSPSTSNYSHISISTLSPQFPLQKLEPIENPSSTNHISLQLVHSSNHNPPRQSPSTWRHQNDRSHLTILRNDAPNTFPLTKLKVFDFNFQVSSSIFPPFPIWNPSYKPMGRAKAAKPTCELEVSFH